MKTHVRHWAIFQATDLHHRFKTTVHDIRKICLVKQSRLTIKVNHLISQAVIHIMKTY